MSFLFHKFACMVQEKKKINSYLLDLRKTKYYNCSKSSFMNRSDIYLLTVVISYLSFTFSVSGQECKSKMEPDISNVIQKEIEFVPESGWKLYDVFSDEFNINSSSPDLNKWYLNNNVCSPPTYTVAYYRNDNLPVIDGKLNMIIRQQSLPYSCEGINYYYSVGSMTSKTKLHYGYVESLVTFPDDNDWRFAFFLFSSGPWGNPTYYDEIDIIEFDQRNTKNVFTHSLHYNDHDLTTMKNVWCHDFFNENHAGKTYLFAVEWLPMEVHWFINGQIVFSKKFTDNLSWINEVTDDNEFACPEYAYPHPEVIYISGGPTKVPSDLSMHYEIDYIHTYKLEQGFDLYWPLAFNEQDLDLFKVHKNLHLGGDGKTFVVSASASHRLTVWATESIILDKGFCTEPSTQFTARTIFTHEDLYNQPTYPKD